MPANDFIVDLARSRRPRVFGTLCWGGITSVTGLLALDELRDIRFQAGRLHVHHVPAEAQAHLVALLAHWAVLGAFALITALCASKSLRALLALPEHGGLGGAFGTGVVVAAESVLIFMLTFVEEPMLLRDGTGLVVYFWYGLVACGLLATRIPRLLSDGLGAWSAWRLLRSAKPAALSQLPSEGRVRVRGRTRADVSLEAGGAVEVGDANGVAVVELDPARLVAPVDGSTLLGQALPADTEVEIVAQAHGGGDAYRGAARLHAGDDRLYLFLGRSLLSGRLLLAAVVELASATVLASGVTSFVVGTVWFWIAAR